MTNIEEIIKRQAMGLVNQLYELAGLTVNQRQSINDKADEIVIDLLRSKFTEYQERTEEDKYVFMQGVPEIHIARLVRRAHSAQNCPHNGNCLTEKEMYAKLREYLKGMYYENKRNNRNLTN
jgi:hypothetical protein